jgi:hypothetical protein
MERNMALIWVAQLDTKQHFFDVTCAEGDLGWFSSQALGVYNCAGALPKAPHTRARKYQHKHDFSFKEVSLAKLKVVWTGGGVFFMSKTDNIFLFYFFAKRVEQFPYHLDIKARENT